MKSCRPIRANTLRQNTVKIMTSASFLTDWMSAPTMVFSPDNKSQRRMVSFCNLKNKQPFESLRLKCLNRRVDNLGWQWWFWELVGLWKFLTRIRFPSRQTLLGTWKMQTIHHGNFGKCQCSRPNGLGRWYSYAMLMTMKSSQFQGSLRKVKPPRQNPLDATLTAASDV